MPTITGGSMTTLSGPDFQWRIQGTVGSTTVDIYLDMPGEYDWPRPETARKSIDPCTGAATLIYRSDGTMPPRQGAPTFRLDCDDTDADTLWAALQTVYALRGPWTITTPTEEFDAVVDPTVAQWRDVNQGIARLISFGWQEVPS